MLPSLDLTTVARLPVRAVLGEVVTALRGGGRAVLVAPPGAGKTTLVPLALADAVSGRIVVAQPRRMAARAAARRMASLVGGRVGELVGFSVRGESRVGPSTRVEVVTTGILLRRLQRDPELAGTAAVMLDECHERHLNTDLALAFLVDVHGTLRPDLGLLAASATVDADRLAGCLGGGTPAPVIATEGALFGIETVWCPPGAPLRPTYGMRVDPRLLDHVAATVGRALREAAGDVLVFLPGVGEISAVADRLADRSAEVDILALHGRQPARVQDAALAEGDRRRVVLATGVAETSLTVPGVRVVVDAGLAREPRYDHARGLGALVTVRVSRATAAQRAGRAGRQGPGRVYRCWSAAEHERLAGHAQPEVSVADLTGFALELACWGHPDGTGLSLPDPPPPAAMRVARSTLTNLGAVDSDGRVTARGRAIAAVGAHPRLARALIDGAPVVGGDRAAQIVAILADEGLAGAADDLVAGWRRLRDGADPGTTARWRAEVQRLTSASRPPPGHHAARTTDAAGLTDDLAAGLVVGLAFPEWVARARGHGTRTYLMTGGTAAELTPSSALSHSSWLAIAVADRAPGHAAARIRLAAAIDEATARQAAAPLLVEADEVGWHDGDVLARRVVRIGAITLSQERLIHPDPDLVAQAIATGLRTEGLSLLSWPREAAALRDRLAFCHHALGNGWPAVDDAALLRRLPEWLGPELARARRRGDLTRIDVGAALRRLLGWREAARLDEVAPERLPVPSGSRIRVDYTDHRCPVLAVKIQEAFGWRSAPTIADGRVTVVLQLLSPAGRPVAITSDLPSFWHTGYPQVRGELRGRYPRHGWPEDPTTAPPARRPPPRR
ncbi:MAG: ATP-dependent helicase HrpB [Micromonosporaceae bacterium]|nr:ATP-dependent helicase HrpB [Micromonosporaceae bacterium]